MANSILTSHHSGTSNTILVSHGWPSGSSANSVLASHDGDYPASGDTTPDAFSFTDQTDVAVNTTRTSNTITVAGITAAASITITGGEYQIGAGSFTSASGTVTNGQTVTVRHTSSASNSTATNTVLTIGGVSDTFTSTTVASGGTTLTHGSEFTITGTGFGTRAAKPLVYDNFESGTPGNDINGQSPTYTSKSSGAWTWAVDSSGVHYPKYSSANQRANSTRNCLLKYGSASGSSYTNTLVLSHDLPNTGDELFFTFWWRYQDTSLANGGTQRYSRNTKPFDLWPEPVGGNPFAYIGMGNPDFGNGELRYNITDGAYVPWDATTQLDLINEEWIRFEVYLKQSAPSTANGEAHTHVHRSTTPSIASKLHAAATSTRTSGNWTNLWIGAYSSTEEEDEGEPNLAWSDIHLDSVYVDTTRQRLELGDNPVYASCTRREVQPSTAWSDTSITALCQKGAIPTGTAYLFVIGADGTASAGIEVDVA